MLDPPRYKMENLTNELDPLGYMGPGAPVPPGPWAYVGPWAHVGPYGPMMGPWVYTIYIR